MPTDYPRPPVRNSEGDRLSFEAGRELTNKLNNLATETGITLYMLLLSAYNILLSKYTGQEEIIVGTPTAGRPHVDLQNIIGMFVNTLAMRNFPGGEKKSSDFWHEVMENSIKAFENQDYQFEELVEKLNLRRDLSRNPLFDTIFVLQNMEVEEIELSNLKLASYGLERRTSKFDLTISSAQTTEGIHFTLEYCAKLFRKETIQRLAAHYLNILAEITDNPEKRLSEIDMLSEGEKKQILIDFNDTKTKYPKDKTIQELFEEQVERAPDNIAVVFFDKQLTYRELNQQANRLANYLRTKGIGTDSIVGIMTWAVSRNDYWHYGNPESWRSLFAN